MVPEDVPDARVLVYDDVSATAAAIADRLVNRLIERNWETHIAVTGGGLGSAIWPHVAAHPKVGDVAWSGVHVWFSDERFVPAGDPDRNDNAVIAVAGELGLPQANIHSVPGPDLLPTLESAALAYASNLARGRVPDPGDVPAPVFSVSILGIGPDGHVASLFPGRPEVGVATGAVLAVSNSPKPPPDRVSFTRPALMQCEELWMIAAGAEKAQAVSRALAGDEVTRTPAAGLHGREATVWLIDAAASGQVQGSNSG
ncbi:MAG: 6-phosphogluconolactonase [Propionibacteriaceae bacterium]|nr:6-phosphogluconolactonase [Propionibacteriaceae bacterium]